METKYFSLEEIALNDGKTKDRIWVVIKDGVYDLTDYLDEHPGGGDLITEWAGKDGTRAFQDFGHSSDAKKDLSKYKIGELKEEERNKGKKTKKVEALSVAEENKENRRSFCNYLTCGLCC